LARTTPLSEALTTFYPWTFTFPDVHRGHKLCSTEFSLPWDAYGRSSLLNGMGLDSLKIEALESRKADAVFNVVKKESRSNSSARKHFGE
jgi:hypothetical protein